MHHTKAKAAAMAAAALLMAGMLASCSKAEEEVSSMISDGKNGMSSVQSKVSEMVSGAESNLSNMNSNGKVDSNASGGTVTSQK